MKRIFLILVLTAACIQGQMVWQAVSSPVSEDLRGVEFANDRFVAAGFAGTILTSPDGITWALQTPDATFDIYGLTYGEERFVAVGSEGRIISSADGIQWNEDSSGTEALLQSVEFYDSLFFASGNLGTILTSNDGLEWQTQETDVISTIFHIVKGGFTYVAFGSNGTFMHSYNTTYWAPHGAHGSIYHGAYGKEKFLAVSEDMGFMQSTSGTSFRTYSYASRNQMYTIHFLDNIFVTAGEGGEILYSVEGGNQIENWTEADFPGGPTLRSIAFGSNRFVTVGDSGTILFSDKTTHAADPGQNSHVTKGLDIKKSGSFLVFNRSQSLSGAALEVTLQTPDGKMIQHRHIPRAEFPLQLPLPQSNGIIIVHTRYGKTPTGVVELILND